MLKKIFLLAITVMLVIGMCGSVNAEELKTKLDIIQQASETQYLENDQGYIDNQILANSILEQGEITVQLELNNTTTESEKNENTEIYIILSENIVRDTEKFTQYVTYIEELATSVFEKNPKNKIGIIGMQGPVRERDENNAATANDQGATKGTQENAEIVVSPTNDITTLKRGLENMNTEKTQYYLNVQAAIRLAKNSYSKNVNKILISLYDDVPNSAIGVCNNVTYGGWSQYDTIEEAVIAKNEDLVKKTKEEMLDLKDEGIDFILLRPANTSFDQTWRNPETGEILLEFDGSPYVQELYGSLEQPTYGKMYSLNNESLEKIVTEYIYEDILETTGAILKSASMKIYFSAEIRDNFTFTTLNENVDNTKLSDEGYIVWNVGDIQTGEKSTLTYTLKIKDMKNTDLLEKTIDINEKIETNYINYLDESTVVVSTDSPKIKLSEVKEQQPVETPEDAGKDDTTIKGDIPQTGENIAIILGLAVMAISLLIIVVKYRKYKEIK